MWLGPAMAVVAALVSGLATDPTDGAPTLASRAATTPRPLVEARFVVVVDAGHGGENHGCRGFDGATEEKAFTLALAFDLRAAIHERLPQARVVLTREDDRSMPLSERARIANANGADVFISLHANASHARTQAGFETYVLDAGASTLEAARTARREHDEGLAVPSANEARPVVAAMVRQLEHAAERSAALRLASVIQREQAGRFPARRDRGVRQAPFDVLLGARMPAVLFEAGFLDHAHEGPALLDPDVRRQIADGLADAIAQHYRERLRSR